MSWERKWLEPGEEVLYGGRRNPFFAVQAVVLILVALTISAITGFMVANYLRASLPPENDIWRVFGVALPVEEGIVAGAALATFTIVTLVWFSLLEPVGPILTDRRVIRPVGGSSRRIESLALGDVAEIRATRNGLVFVAGAPGAVRFLQRGSDAEPAPVDRIELHLSRRALPFVRESDHDKVLRLLGRPASSFTTPGLPPQIRRFVLLDRALPGAARAILVVLALLLLRGRFIDLAGADWLVFTGLGLFGLLFYAVGVASRYFVLWRAARRLSPDDLRLFLCAVAHPDWRDSYWDRFIGVGERLRVLARQEHFLFRLTGQPVSSADGPGPEAFGGGWRV